MTGPMPTRYKKDIKSLALGFCGLKCETCPVFIATIENNNALRQETAEEWTKIYAPFLGKELKREDMSCSGCRSQGNHFLGCTDCSIRKCCAEKKLTTCAPCTEYETCQILNGFVSYHHLHAKENLDGLRSGPTK